MNRTILAAAICTLVGGSALAETNLDKLGALKVTGTKEHAVVDQGGPSADAIRATLADIEMPDGFSIDLYALVPDGRHMAVAHRSCKVAFVGTKKTKVWTVIDLAPATASPTRSRTSLPE